jgi:hypothetical protein
MFASCYGETLVERMRASGAVAEEVRTGLSPHRLIARAKRKLAQVRADLDERVRSSALLAARAEQLRQGGCGDDEIARSLESLGAYQLQHVRSFAEFVLELPPDLRRFELGAGLVARNRLLFATLADYVHLQAQALDRLEARVRTAVT